MCFKIINGDVEIDPLLQVFRQLHYEGPQVQAVQTIYMYVLISVNLALLIEYSLHGIIFQLAYLMLWMF